MTETSHKKKTHSDEETSVANWFGQQPSMLPTKDDVRYVYL